MFAYAGRTRISRFPNGIFIGRVIGGEAESLRTKRFCLGINLITSAQPMIGGRGTAEAHSTQRA